jgi:hypothetical protein
MHVACLVHKLGHDYCKTWSFTFGTCGFTPCSIVVDEGGLSYGAL